MEMEGFMAQKRGLWNLERNKALQDRGAFPMEEGDTIRECKAMYEENFLTSWLRDDGKNKEERIMEANKETKEETGKKRFKRRGERREREGNC